MELFNQITPTIVYASLTAYLYLVILGAIEQFMTARDDSGNMLIYVFRTATYMTAALAGIYLIGEKFGFEDPLNFMSLFTVLYCGISIGIRITSHMNMRVNAAPFLAYVYYPILLIFWILMSSISANTVNNIMQLRNCITQLGNLHTFRKFPKWFVWFVNKLYWIGLNINYRSSKTSKEDTENTYKHSHIKYERSVGRPSNMREAISSLIDSPVFKEIGKELREKHKEIYEETDKLNKSFDDEGVCLARHKIDEKEYNEVAKSFGVKTHSSDGEKKILDNTSSDKKE